MATKRGKSTKGKGKEKDISDRPNLAFTILTESQTSHLMKIPSPDDIEREIREIMKITDVEVDIKQSAILDFYVLTFHWARSQPFNVQQVSAVFTLCHNLLNNIKDKHLSRVENLKELRKLLAGINVENAEVTGGLDFFSLAETKVILQYLTTSFFQHYGLYEFVFSKERTEEIVGLDVEVQTAKSADIPWPPPLTEAIKEEAYDRFVRTPPPTAEPDVSAAEQTEPDTSVEQAEQEAEIVAKLSPEEIQSILDSVCKEMLGGFEKEVVQKLRDREISFLNRINKIHKVAET